MKGSVLLCVLLSVVSIDVASCNSSTVICVHAGVEVKSSQKESWPNCTTVCTSFECVNDNITNSTDVLFETNQIGLNWLFNFSHLNNIALIGLCEEQTTVTCNSTDSTGAGLAFISTKNLTIANLTFRHCGALHNSTTVDYKYKNHTVDFISAIYIVNSTNVFIEKVTVSSSTGNGIAFFDTNGTVTVKRSSFEQNKVQDSVREVYSGGGGVRVEFTYCTPGIYGECDHSNQHTNNSRYTFQECHFTRNIANSVYPQHSVETSETDFQGLGRGGGLCIFLSSKAFNNNIDISDCKFQSNQAVWGGGLYIRFQDATTNNSVMTSNSTFENNTCSNKSGGGACIGWFFNVQSPQANSIYFHNCTFTRNKAMHGGALRIFSSPSEQSKNSNTINFTECSWLENTAQYGSAVDISPHAWQMLSTGFLPTPVFTNCAFISNSAKNIFESTSSLTQYNASRGTFMVTGFSVQFEGELYFTNNNGSAVYATSSILQFAPGMNATFVNNSGTQGGAVALIGFSAMYVNDNSTFTFINNTAIAKGGAIFFYSIDKHDFLSSYSCFIQYKGHTECPQERDILFSFYKNRAALATALPRNESLDFGHSIFATSLNSCQRACSPYPERNPYAFGCIGNFTANNDSDPGMKNEMSTYGGSFSTADNTCDSHLPLTAIPGKEVCLPIVIEDDLQHQANQTFQVSIQNDPDSNITLSDAYSYTSNKHVVVFGKPNDTGNLTLNTLGFREVGVSLRIELEECPPGYVLHNISRFQTIEETCICSADLNSSFVGIHKCNKTLFQAYIHRGYWVGYVSSETEAGLLSTYCPKDFCFPYEDPKLYHLLPDNASKKALDDLVCGPSHTGIICGNCRKGYSVHFHNDRLKCVKNRYCRFGWLFYILSELFPLTVLFVLVVVFNISFTGGAANGFIFYAQVLESLSLTANDFIIFPTIVLELSIIHRFIYRFFNLDFFSISALSFCVWDTATAIDVIAIKYITVLYALLLVLATIFLMNVCNCYRMCPCLRTRTVKNSIIHGLTAFLVMCYAQCARVSLDILTRTDLYSRGGVYNRTVVFYQGNIVFLSPQYLPYAIPAILSLATIVAIPPLLLLIYPTHYKIIALLRLDKSEKLQRILKWFPIEKLKPLLDSFQSCFKDNLRFFSGLYFVYRLLPLITNAVTTSMTQQYTIVEIQFIAILMAHAIAQPYQKRWHNILDTLIFANLAIINGLTLYNYTRAAYGDHNVQHIIDSVSSVQIVLVYLPMIYMAVFVSVYLLRRAYKLYSKTSTNSDDHTEDVEFPARLIEEENEYMSLEYEHW